jgi:phosphatidylserine decarboxylase
MASVMVGAMIVAGIETVWSGQEAPILRTTKTRHFDTPHDAIVLDRGQEMGRFKLGSTVILLFPRDTIDWLDTLAPGSTVRMGQPLAHITETVQAG